MSEAIKNVVILGSTGSIGRQTLEVIRALPQRFRVIGLAAGKDVDLLAGQIAEFKPGFIYYENSKTCVRPGLAACEFQSLEDMACHPEADIIVVATSGKAGLSPTLVAVTAGKTVALANKEPLIMAGEIIIDVSKKSGARILPVDSEHSAIWQCLQGETQPAAGLILTASGGPFRHYSTARLRDVTVAEALQHPSWKMGKKVTIDSATLMNKGLEVIEAHWLFDMPFENIKILVHPQSIIHSMVEFVDGSVKAQLSCPDMRIPIQYALSYPDRLANVQLPRLDWHGISALTFEDPDTNTFPCLKLAIEAGKQGGTYPAVLCAADEIAVQLFLSQRIKFTDIAPYVEQTLEQHHSISHPTLDDILAADAWARDKLRSILEIDYVN